MLKKISVKTKPAYPVCIAAEESSGDLFDEVRKRLPRVKKLGIVTNPRIKKLHGSLVEAALKERGFEVTFFIMKEGEKYKEYGYASSFFEQLINAGFDRSSALLALGGGVVGDFTGYLASSFLRGIGFAQMPTSFLACVDASVGGKVAVNIGNGKNMVGHFYQPAGVFIYLPFLSTLPAREWKVGWAEVIKHALIGDRKLYNLLLSQTDAVASNQPDVVITAIERSVKLKADVVHKDEKEGGLRAILNFGHTVGHALESYFHYSGLTHGEAVATGMVCALLISVKQSGFSEEKFWKIYDLINAVGLPVKSNVSFADINKHLQFDKKKVDGVVHFVLLPDIGKAEFGQTVEKRMIKLCWERQQKLNFRNRKI